MPAHEPGAQHARPPPYAHTPHRSHVSGRHPPARLVMHASSPPPGDGPEPACPVPPGDGHEDHDYSPLLDLLQRFPGLFEKYVLKRLDPAARASLAGAGSVFRDVVYPRSIFPTGLPRAEKALGRVWARVRVFKLVDFLGSGERLAWAKDNGCPWEARTCELAARGGHLDALKRARKLGCGWDRWTCARAAAGGHLEAGTHTRPLFSLI